MEEAVQARQVGRRQSDDKAWNAYVERLRPDHIFYIDIVGTCNLRCPSCAVGNYAPQFPRSLMPITLFERILDKIEREHAGERIDIELYCWGEPVLHKGLAQIISLVKSRGLSVGLSCNMNEFPRMREVVSSEPDFLRISLSGSSNDVYQLTHRGGDIDAVKNNMRLLRRLLDETGASTLVQVFYHVYRHNLGEDFDSMRRLCAELDFLFQAYVATLRPVEKTIAAMQAIVAPEDQSVVDLLPVSMPDASRIAVSQRGSFADCPFRTGGSFIHTDASVRLCGVSFDRKSVVAESFLDTSRAELRKRRYENSLCDSCLASGADLVLSGSVQTLLHEKAVETLGRKWSDYLRGK